MSGVVSIRHVALESCVVVHVVLYVVAVIVVEVTVHQALAFRKQFVIKIELFRKEIWLWIIKKKKTNKRCFKSADLILHHSLFAQYNNW